MSNQEKKGGNLIAIATMFALYGMVGFVTFMAAPVGAIWKEQPGIAGSPSGSGSGLTRPMTRRTGNVMPTACWRSIGSMA